MIKDTFSYTARWDSVGLDCADCTHFEGPQSWPDSERASRCSLHDLSLEIELGADGYKNGEWFCREFQDSGNRTRPSLIARLLGLRGSPRTSPAALRHLDENRDQLQSDMLYGFYGRDGNLKEFPFSELRSEH